MKFKQVYKEGVDQYHRNSKYLKKCELCGKEFSAIGYEDKVCKDCLKDFHKRVGDMTNDSIRRVNGEKEHHMINTRR